jgi:hypothetical protein
MTWLYQQMQQQSYAGLTLGLATGSMHALHAAPHYTSITPNRHTNPLPPTCGDADLPLFMFLCSCLMDSYAANLTAMSGTSSSSVGKNPEEQHNNNNTANE